jgi:IS30 family transposase
MSKQGIKIINDALIREVQRLRFVKEMSYREIGKELDIGKDTVAKALKLGDKTLQTDKTVAKSKSIRHKKPRMTIAEEHELDIQKDIINEEKELHTALTIVKGKVGQALKERDDKLLVKMLSPYVDILKTSGQLKK